jgi:hypothetical protein
MHELHDFPVDPSGHDAELAPKGLPLLRGGPDKRDLALLAAEIGQGAFGNLEGDPLLGFVLGGKAESWATLLSFRRSRMT